MAEREITISIKANNLTKVEFDKARHDLLGLGSAANDVNKSGGNLRGTFTNAAAGFGAFVAGSAVFSAVKNGLTSVVGGAFAMNAELEKSTLQFGTLMGDSTRAEAHVKSLFEFAKKTPFETGPIVQASRMMQTFGGDALNTMDNLTLLGDASAATGAPIEDLGFWVGRMYANLKAGQPFGEAAARLQELAVLTPSARAEMEALQKSGKSGDEVFAAFTSRMGAFSGAMVEQANTWDGLKSSISDAVNIMMADALHPMFDLVKTGAQIVLTALGSDGMQGAFASLKGGMSGALGTDAGGGAGIIKQFATVVLTGIDLSLAAVGLFGQGLGALKAIVYGVAVGVISSIEQIVLGFHTFVSSAAKIPGIGDKFKGLADGVQTAADFMGSLRTGMTDLTKEAIEGAKGNDTWGKSIAGARTVVQTLRTEIENATVSTNTATTATKKASDGKGEYVAKTKEQIAADKEHTKHLEKLGEAVDAIRLKERFRMLAGEDLRASMKATNIEIGHEITALGRTETAYFGVLQSSSALATSLMTTFKPAVRDSRDELTELHNRTASAFTGLVPIVEQVATAINGTFAQIALGAKGFKDGMGDIWESIKAGAMKAFTDILGDFTNRLMAGMLNAMRGQQGAFGQAFNGFLGGGGGGVGGGIATGVGGGAGAGGVGAGAAGAGGVGAAGAGAAGAGGGGGAAGGGAGVSAAVIGVAATAAVGFAMGQLGQQIFGGAGWQAGTFGAASGAATGAMIGSVLPGIGTAVGAIVGGLVGMASGFIGVSKGVKQSRAQIAAFQVAVRETLTDEQRLEAGGEAWKETVIAVRDAYLATGRSAEEAEQMVLQMWKTDKPKEAEAAVRAIAAVMDEAAARAAGVWDEVQTLTRSTEGASDAADTLKVAMAVVQVSEQALADLEAMGGSTEEITEAQRRLQAAMADLEIAQHAITGAVDLERATRDVEDAADDGVRAFDRINRSIQAIPRDIRVEVTGTYTPPDIDGAGPDYVVGTMGVHGSWFQRYPESGMAARLHGEEAVITRDQAPRFVADYLHGQSGRTGGAAAAPVVNVYALVEVDTAGQSTTRAISADEYLRRKINQMQRAGQIQTPSRTVGAVS